MRYTLEGRYIFIVERDGSRRSFTPKEVVQLSSQLGQSEGTRVKREKRMIDG